MRCALCLVENPLRNSHIYPEWLYKPLYDEKHRLQVLSIVPEGGNEWKQKGMREPLLCDGCEQKLSVWEGYVRDVFFQPKSPLEIEHLAPNLIEVRGLNFEKFRLFELSILWRAGVSTLPFFSKVRLGELHQERLRQLVNASHVGDPAMYGVLMYGLKVGESPETLQAIAEPRPARVNGLRAYNLTFGGFLWMFYVSSQHAPGPIRLASLTPAGTRIISIQNALEMKNMVAFAHTLRRMGRASSLE